MVATPTDSMVLHPSRTLGPKSEYAVAVGRSQ